MAIAPNAVSTTKSRRDIANDGSFSARAAADASKSAVSVKRHVARVLLDFDRIVKHPVSHREETDRDRNRKRGEITARDRPHQKHRRDRADKRNESGRWNERNRQQDDQPLDCQESGRSELASRLTVCESHGTRTRRGFPSSRVRRSRAGGCRNTRELEEKRQRRPGSRSRYRRSNARRGRAERPRDSYHAALPRCRSGTSQRLTPNDHRSWAAPRLARQTRYSKHASTFKVMDAGTAMTRSRQFAKLMGRYTGARNAGLEQRVDERIDSTSEPAAH